MIIACSNAVNQLYGIEVNLTAERLGSADIEHARSPDRIGHLRLVGMSAGLLNTAADRHAATTHSYRSQCRCEVWRCAKEKISEVFQHEQLSQCRSRQRICEIGEYVILEVSFFEIKSLFSNEALARDSPDKGAMNIGKIEYVSKPEE